MKTFRRFLREQVGGVGRPPSWVKNVDATGETPDGTWYLQKNTDEDKSPWRGEVTTHIISLVGRNGSVVAYVYADAYDDRLYINYGAVVDGYRGRGVYKNLLASLRRQFTVHSDEQHNVHDHARKAYERLGGRTNRYGRYVLDRALESNEVWPSANEKYAAKRAR